MRAAREAGATHLWWNLLNLRPGTREYFTATLAREWPEQLARYESLYAGAGYLRPADAGPLERRLAALRGGSGIRDRRRIRLTPEPEPIQLALLP